MKSLCKGGGDKAAQTYKSCPAQVLERRAETGTAREGQPGMEHWNLSKMRKALQ